MVSHLGMTPPPPPPPRRPGVHEPWAAYAPQRVADCASIAQAWPCSAECKSGTSVRRVQVGRLQSSPGHELLFSSSPGSQACAHPAQLGCLLFACRRLSQLQHQQQVSLSTDTHCKSHL